jgi:Protein of unknown function, DUF488
MVIYEKFKMKEENKSIWTIGHSTRPFEEFVAMLHSFKIESLADIRSYPGSRKFPQFNKEALEISLPQKDIQYFHLKALGGRRKVNPESKNTSWRHLAFRSYADYMVEKPVCLTRRYRFPLTHIWIESHIISGSASNEISGSRTPKIPLILDMQAKKKSMFIRKVPAVCGAFR